MGYRWFDDLWARLCPIEEEFSPTLLYWRVYETTDARVSLGLAPYGAMDGYPTRGEAVIAARRMSRAASREGRPERYCVGALVEEVADPLEGRCLR